MRISDEDCESARRVAAEVVRVMGDRYWPLFDMVDAECTLRRERQRKLDHCLEEAASRKTRSRPGPARHAGKARAGKARAGSDPGRS